MRAATRAAMRNKSTNTLHIPHKIHMQTISEKPKEERLKESLEIFRSLKSSEQLLNGKVCFMNRSISDAWVIEK